VVLQVLADARDVGDDVDAVFAQVAPGPMPESISSCGLATAPADSTISALARVVWVTPPRR